MGTAHEKEAKKMKGTVYVFLCLLVCVVVNVDATHFVRVGKLGQSRNRPYRKNVADGVTELGRDCAERMKLCVTLGTYLQSKCSAMMAANETQSFDLFMLDNICRGVNQPRPHRVASTSDCLTLSSALVERFSSLSQADRLTLLVNPAATNPGLKRFCTVRSRAENQIYQRRICADLLDCYASPKDTTYFQSLDIHAHTINETEDYNRTELAISRVQQAVTTWPSEDKIGLLTFLWEGLIPEEMDWIATRFAQWRVLRTAYRGIGRNTIYDIGRNLTDYLNSGTRPPPPAEKLSSYENVSSILHSATPEERSPFLNMLWTTSDDGSKVNLLRDMSAFHAVGSSNVPSLDVGCVAPGARCGTSCLFFACTQQCCGERVCRNSTISSVFRCSLDLPEQ